MVELVSLGLLLLVVTLPAASSAPTLALFETSSTLSSSDFKLMIYIVDASNGKIITVVQ